MLLIQRYLVEIIQRNKNTINKITLSVNISKKVEPLYFQNFALSKEITSLNVAGLSLIRLMNYFTSPLNNHIKPDSLLDLIRLSIPNIKHFLFLFVNHRINVQLAYTQNRLPCNCALKCLIIMGKH